MKKKQNAILNCIRWSYARIANGIAKKVFASIQTVTQGKLDLLIGSVPMGKWSEDDGTDIRRNKQRKDYTKRRACSLQGLQIRKTDVPAVERYCLH